MKPCSKLWYPVQEYSCWFGTLFKSGISLSCCQHKNVQPNYISLSNEVHHVNNDRRKTSESVLSVCENWCESVSRSSISTTKSSATWLKKITRASSPSWMKDVGMLARSLMRYGGAQTCRARSCRARSAVHSSRATSSRALKGYAPRGRGRGRGRSIVFPLPFPILIFVAKLGMTSKRSGHLSSAVSVSPPKWPRSYAYNFSSVCVCVRVRVFLVEFLE